MVVDLIWRDPEDDAETRLRMRPLREHWEARGPGLMKHVMTRLPWIRVPSRPVVRLVLPRKGGGGRIVSPTEVEFEAVLANPFCELPEVVRLGWLCCCLGFGGEPRNSIALIPPLLEAGQYVGWTRFDTATCDLALKEWFDERPALTQEYDLIEWWEVEGSRAKDSTGWQVAVARLTSPEGRAK